MKSSFCTTVNSLLQYVMEIYSSLTDEKYRGTEILVSCFLSFEANKLKKDAFSYQLSNLTNQCLIIDIGSCIETLQMVFRISNVHYFLFLDQFYTNTSVFCILHVFLFT